MSTTEVLGIVKDRGLTLALKDGKPVIRRNGKNEAVTDALLKVLTIHRERIIEMLKKEQG